MTGHAVAAPATRFDPTARIGLSGVVAAEWTKLRSLRSTVWSYAALVVLSLGFTALVTSVVMSQWDTTSAADRATYLADPSGFLAPALAFGQVPLCVLGVLAVTAEYTSGTIRASLLAVPRRVPVLAAKVAVFAAVTLVVTEAIAFAAFALGQAVIAEHIPASLHDPGVLRSVIGAGVFLTVLGVFALGVGALLRHTAAAVTVVIGCVLVLSQLAFLLPGGVGEHVAAFLPANAGQRFASASDGPDDVLSPWQGLGVLCLWTALALGLAGYRFRRRDV